LERAVTIVGSASGSEASPLTLTIVQLTKNRLSSTRPELWPGPAPRRQLRVAPEREDGLASLRARSPFMQPA